jgi:hypothetical protein
MFFIQNITTFLGIFYHNTGRRNCEMNPANKLSDFRTRDLINELATRPEVMRLPLGLHKPYELKMKYKGEDDLFSDVDEILPISSVIKRERVSELIKKYWQDRSDLIKRLQMQN